MTARSRPIDQKQLAYQTYEIYSCFDLVGISDDQFRASNESNEVMCQVRATVFACQTAKWVGKSPARCANYMALPFAIINSVPPRQRVWERAEVGSDGWRQVRRAQAR